MAFPQVQLSESKRELTELRSALRVLQKEKEQLQEEKQVRPRCLASFCHLLAWKRAGWEGPEAAHSADPADWKGSLAEGSIPAARAALPSGEGGTGSSEAKTRLPRPNLSPPPSQELLEYMRKLEARLEKVADEKWSEDAATEDEEATAGLSPYTPVLRPLFP